ncbi:MAG: alpha-L-glutamate ligase-like protein [Verrucomicrobiota bacterium]
MKPRTVGRWWHRWFLLPSELRALGVVGINMRNARWLLPHNPRAYYRNVDDKLRTKELALRNDLAVPETYAVVHSPGDIAGLMRTLEKVDSFVIKPARGSGGKGVIVIDGRQTGGFVKPSGTFVPAAGIRYHVSDILAGLFSLGGRRDAALAEYRVRPARVLTDISYQGAPDIRVVLLHGYPVMAMVRTATRESDGRANLHQGALGIGICLASGCSIRAVHHGMPVLFHPDTKAPLIGVRIPEWERLLEIACICQEMSGLGYLGVDMMIDESRGPLMIEVNARPGLAIQLANGAGLMCRLEAVARHHALHPGLHSSAKIAFSKLQFSAST